MQMKITTCLKHLIKPDSSAREAWNALEVTFRSQSIGRKALLRQQLKDSKRKEKKMSKHTFFVLKSCVLS